MTHRLPVRARRWTEVAILMRSFARVVTLSRTMRAEAA
jgi:hypothetical protein